MLEILEQKVSIKKLRRQRESIALSCWRKEKGESISFVTEKIYRYLKKNIEWWIEIDVRMIERAGKVIDIDGGRWRELKWKYGESWKRIDISGRVI